MQHPVGYAINPTTHQPELNNVLALFTNPTFLWGYVHVILASLVTGCVVMLAVSAWYLRRKVEVEAFKRSAHLALIVLIPSLGLALFVGSELGVVEDKYQPIKIAAAEAQWNTCQPCSFSVFQIGGGKHDMTPTKVIAIPDLLSFLATNSFKGKVVGLNQLQQQYTKQYGPGDYIPNVFIQYWSMRVMAYLAAALFVFALWGGWLIRRGKLELSRWFLVLAGWAVVVPFLMNTAGWMLTENGRQPWIVQGLMKTTQGVSPSVSTTEIWISLITFVLIYVVLGVADLVLMMRYARRGLPDEQAVSTSGEGELPGRSAAGDGLLMLAPPHTLVRRDRVLLDGLLRPGGIRLRGRRAARRRRQDQRGAGGGARIDRAVLGRKRGLADRRRRGHVRRVPGLVRDDVLEPVPGAAARPGGADGTRCRVRVPEQARGPAVAPRRGRGRRSEAARSCRCWSASASATCSTACRSTRATSSPETSSIC